MINFEFTCQGLQRQVPPRFLRRAEPFLPYPLHSLFLLSTRGGFWVWFTCPPPFRRGCGLRGLETGSRRWPSQSSHGGLFFCSWRGVEAFSSLLTLPLVVWHPPCPGRVGRCGLGGTQFRIGGRKPLILTQFAATKLLRCNDNYSERLRIFEMSRNLFDILSEMIEIFAGIVCYKWTR